MQQPPNWSSCILLCLEEFILLTATNILSFKYITGCIPPLLEDSPVTSRQFGMKPQLLALWGLGFWKPPPPFSPSLVHSEPCSVSSFCSVDVPRLPLPRGLCMTLPSSWNPPPKIMAPLLPHCWCCLSPCLTPVSREAPPLCPPLPITLPRYLPRTALVITQNHLHHWHTCALSSLVTGMHVPGLFFIPSTSSVLTTVCLSRSRRSMSDCSQNQPQGPKLQIRFIPGCCPRTLL